MRWPAILLLSVAACGPVTVSSVAYTTACPQGDAQCEMRQNAATLYYLGQDAASYALICSGDESVRLVLGKLCF